MAEKRVSVRLSAVGGRQVRAELEGVGEAGAKGFGRLSREMEAANKRLAGFSRRISAAVGAAMAAAIPAMGQIASATIQAAAETRELAQVANATPEAFQRWAGAARTVGIEEEKLADILKDVNDRVGDFLSTGGGPMADFFENVAPKVGVTADQFARLSGPEALQLFVNSLERAGLGQQEMTFYLEAMASDVTRLLPLLRNGGSEMGRLGQQAEDLGAVMDSSTIETMRRAQIALIGVGQVFEGMRNQIGAALAPAMTDLANAFIGLASSGGVLHRTFHALIDNLERLAAYAGTFVAFMASRWVAGMAAAALSVRGLATALVVLRGALTRTGIGALIVGAGELIYWFGQLVRGAGGFGQAMGLLGNLGSAVFSEMGQGGNALVAVLEAAAWSIARGFVDAFKWIFDQWTNLLETMYGPFNALMEKVGSEFRLSAPNPIGDMLGGASDWLGSQAGKALSRAEEIYAGMEGTRAAVAALVAAVNSADTDAEGALEGTRDAAQAVTDALNRAGAAGSAAGTAVKAGSEQAATGWAATLKQIDDYVTSARDIGGEIGQSLVSAFKSAETAVSAFVKTGKLNFRDLVTSLIADLAKLAARKFILGPIANALGGILGRAGGVFADVLHAGGMVGAAGSSRMVPAMAFAAAPRMHAGGVAGLRHDEVPAILQRGERVLSRSEAQSYGAGGEVTVNIYTRDAESFRQSRTQVAADVQRAVAMGRRGM